MKKEVMTPERVIGEVTVFGQANAKLQKVRQHIEYDMTLKDAAKKILKDKAVGWVTITVSSYNGRTEWIDEVCKEASQEEQSA